VERPKPSAPPAVKPAAPNPVLAQRVPQPWEDGPQPTDLLKPGPGVEAPVPLDFPRYSYPAAARGTGLKADVKLAVLVDERGRVIDARVREGAPPDLGFAETAIAAAKRIPFQPASRYDIPGKMWTEVILEFVE
jgi:TonB family protein